MQIIVSLVQLLFEGLGSTDSRLEVTVGISSAV